MRVSQIVEGQLRLAASPGSPRESKPFPTRVEPLASLTKVSSDAYGSTRARGGSPVVSRGVGLTSDPALARWEDDGGHSNWRRER